jgi:hypothetical protein
MANQGSHMASRNCSSGIDSGIHSRISHIQIETCIQAQACNQDYQPDIATDIASSLTSEARYRILADYSPDWEYWIGVDEEDHRRCFAVGMNDILIKPYDPQDLVRMLLKHFVSTRKSA